MQALDHLRRHYSKDLDTLTKIWNDDPRNYQLGHRLVTRTEKVVHKATRKLEIWKHGRHDQPLTSALKEQLRIVEQVEDQLKARKALRGRIEELAKHEERRRDPCAELGSMKQREKDMSECIIREYARVAVSAARVFAKALLIFANDSATYHAALQTKFRILCQETTGSFVAEERRESKDQDHHFVPSDSDSDDDHWFEL